MNKEYQKIADNICKEFELPCIPIAFDDGTKAPLKLKKDVLGCYYGYVIVLRDFSLYDVDQSVTLLHELAHHLESTRFQKRIEGYYKMEIWPAMELSRIDENNQKWYAATGKPHPVYIRIDRTMHGKLFRKCLREIKEYYDE